MNERLVPADPVRLLASADSTDLERTLLRSWDSERPAEGAHRQTLAALGLATAVAGGAAVVAGTSIAPSAAGVGWAAIVKWAAIGVAALGLTAAGVAAIRSGSHEEAAQSQPAAAIAQQTPTQSEAPARTIELGETPAAATPRAASPAHAASRASRTADSLADQVAELDRARAALDANAPERALRLVDAYEATYPTGALTQEAELLRLEALSLTGDRREIERVGKRFLASYPKSPHAARVRSLLGYAP